MNTPLDLGQIPARDGLWLIVDQFTATPAVVVDPVVRWVVVPAALLTAAVWAVLVLVGRHPDAALPPAEPEPQPVPEPETGPIADILNGRRSIDDTVPLRVPR